MALGEVHNAAIAELLYRYAAALTAVGADRFKVKAYRKAADTIERLRADVGEMARNGQDLRAIPGVGAAISAALQEIVRTGKLARLEEIMAGLSPAAVE